jgi:hypothetical protein
MSIFVIENEDGTLSHPVARINVLRRFPHVSFPKVMTGYVNPEMGIYPIVKTDPPESQYSHLNVQVDPVKQGDHYVQQWGAAVPRPQEEIDAYYNRKISRVKNYAGELILARYPDWKQRNMTMRVLTLQNISPLTDDEQAELASISVAWDWIEAVRTASDQVEADLLAMGIAAAMEYDISTSAHWTQ